MTKARDISSLIGSSGQIDNTKITLDVNEIPNLDAGKITSGSLGTDRIPNLDASKITTGEIADARISQSSVSQHATSFDDNKIVNDISTLALRQASDQNKSAYNTNSQFVDVFQDATGIDTITNASRDTSEFVSSVQEIITDSAFSLTNSNPSLYNTYFTMDDTAWVNAENTDGGSLQYAKTTNYTSNSTGSYINLITHFSGVDTWNVGNSLSRNNWVIGFDFGENRLLRPTAIDWTHRSGYGNMKNPQGVTTWASNDLSTITTFTTNYFQANPTSSAGASSINTNTFYRYVGFTYQFVGGTNTPQTNDGKITGTLRTTSLQLNATGSFEGITITAPSSVSSMGAIITYQDQAGTNTLNTDIILQLSADNGSTYSTATLTALPNFATGIKMAKVNDLAVTAGTQLKYRLNFANQASGSKEARIRGVALQY